MKKGIIIFVVLAVALSAILTIYKIDSIKKSENRVLELGEYFIKNSIEKNFESLENIVRGKNGEELTK